MTRDRKYVIPFPNGITVPTEDFTSTSHNRKLSFPGSYEPAIMSALKVLARPETYQSDDTEELNYSVQQGMDILSSAEDNGGVGYLIPNWGFTVSSLNDIFTYSVPPVYGIASKKSYMYFATAQSGSEPYIDFTLYGGLGGVCDLSLTLDPPTRLYTIYATNCFNTVVTDTDFSVDRSISKHYDGVKQLHITIADCSFVFGVLTVLGDATCGDV